MKENRTAGNEISRLLRNNIRDYAMFIALFVLFIFFSIATNGLFVSPKNINDLINQTAYVAVMAIGMTLVIIMRHIDLSIGFVAGFLGAVAALLMKSGVPVYIVIPVILACGLIVGFYQGTMVAYVSIPAFVITLAGMFIFRGLLSMTTAATGTIIVNDEIFKAINNGVIPDGVPKGGGLHWLTLVIGAVIAGAIVFSQIQTRLQKKRYNIEVNSVPVFLVTQVFFIVVIMAVAFVLAQWNGLPWAAVVVAIVFLIFNFMLNKTRLGRSIYGIGGNPEAAELSGINVKRVTLLVFGFMSMLAALGGMMYTSRLASATPTAGVGFELDAIAATFIGGTSVYGGVGKLSNTIIGALVIITLTNGMNLMGVDISFQYVFKGLIFTLAVAFDIITRSKIKS